MGPENSGVVTVFNFYIQLWQGEPFSQLMYSLQLIGMACDPQPSV